MNQIQTPRKIAHISTSLFIVPPRPCPKWLSVIAGASQALAGELRGRIITRWRLRCQVSEQLIAGWGGSGSYLPHMILTFICRWDKKMVFFFSGLVVPINILSFAVASLLSHDGELEEPPIPHWRRPDELELSDWCALWAPEGVINTRKSFSLCANPKRVGQHNINGSFHSTYKIRSYAWRKIL